MRSRDKLAEFTGRYQQHIPSPVIPGNDPDAKLLATDICLQFM
ncbi:MAG: hypothetical protein JWR19_4121 [Pedosphaera sp.]|nr:hypothetical protein [Pedosphaera sp.]